MEYGNQIYGRLHRDMLSFSIEKKFTKNQYKFYGWILINANPYTGEVTHTYQLEYVQSLLRIKSKKTLYTLLDEFQEYRCYVREMNDKNNAISTSIKGNAPHISLTRADEKRYQLLADKDVFTKDPRANLIYGKLPQTFLKIAIDNDFKAPQHRHYWWITLNITDKPGEGWLTKKIDIPDLAELLDLKVPRLLENFRRFAKTGLFIPSSPSHIQGKAPHIVQAAEQVREIGRKNEYEVAEKKYVEWEKRKAAERNVTFEVAHAKMHADLFKKYFEEHGEYLVPSDMKTD